MKKNETFSIAYAKIINRFTFEFGKDFCDESGEIDWKKLIIFNSGISNK
ncbi:MAG: hypothetical protein RLZZ628_3743 [Bacteroidota bacterium]|jgi:hypothetical protein